MEIFASFLKKGRASWPWYKSLLALGCLSGIALAQTDPCAQLADMQASSSDMFVGFGAGLDQQAADANAQVDLARHIRQQVDATTVVTEDNTNASLSSTAQSTVSAVLVGAKVLRRCAATDSSTPTYSTVMTLEKNLFVTSLEEALKQKEQQGLALYEKLKPSAAGSSLPISTADVQAAKAFVKSYQTVLSEDEQLCKIYKGCQNSKLAQVTASLAAQVEAKAEQIQYKFVAQNRLAQRFEGELTDFLKEAGYSIGPSSESKRVASASCHTTASSVMGGNQVVTLRCRVQCYEGSQVVFNKELLCKAMADKNILVEDAAASCHGRLTPTP